MKRIVLSLSLLAGCGVDPSESNVDIIGGEKVAADPTKPSDFPATIGIKIYGPPGYFNGCTGTRIGSNTYLTAAHCFDNVPGAKQALGEVFGSNTSKFDEINLTNIRLHPTYKAGATSAATRGVDLATFTIHFPAAAHKALWDKFVTIAPIQYSRPVLGLPVRIAGYGCAAKTFGLDDFDAFKLFEAKCERTDFKYMKAARNKIENVFENTFTLDGSTNKDGITGFISNGDSGGPVYAENGSLIGVTSSGANGLLAFNDGFGISTFHIWLGFSDAKSFVASALADDTKNTPFQASVAYQSVTFPDGGTYKGPMLMGLRDGTKGKMFYPDGRVYEGDWTSDKRSGYGEQFWGPDDPKFVEYKGNWSNDKMNGTGTVKFKDGEIYEGQIKNNLYHGKGKRTLPNKDIREGTWVEGKLDGESILTTTAGVKWKEVYKSGDRISATKI